MSISQEVRYTSNRTNMYAVQDDCLISIEDGEPIRTASLLRLPPWRAVLVARMGQKAGVPLEQGTVEQLIAEAWEAGGNGTLGEWWKRK